MRLEQAAWNDVEESLWRMGYAKLPAVLTAPECAELRELSDRQDRIRDVGGSLRDRTRRQHSNGTGTTMLRRFDRRRWTDGATENLTDEVKAG